MGADIQCLRHSIPDWNSLIRRELLSRGDTIFYTATGSALLAALLFGVMTPVSKYLLPSIGPIMIAALYYLGTGSGLCIIRCFGMLLNPHREQTEAPVSGRDIPWLAVATICGGIIGPILLMVSLMTVPAGTASLLLNAELVMTTLIAILWFREPSDTRTWIAILLVISASLILSYNPEEKFGLSVGAIGIILACICWGVDNNATRIISGKDPVTLTIIKGLVAGSCSLILALLSGESFPGIEIILIALIAGFLGYGLSILLFIRSLRILGAARTGSLFACAPFIGVIISVLFLRENPEIFPVLSLPFMIAGVLLIITEHHGHRHAHTGGVHDHRHRHDDSHHLHTHTGRAESVVHAHVHTHTPIEHEHPHTPDMHHHHTHAGDEQKKDEDRGD